jgi:hypothetical protein
MRLPPCLLLRVPVLAQSDLVAVVPTPMLCPRVLGITGSLGTQLSGTLAVDLLSIRGVVLVPELPSSIDRTRDAAIADPIVFARAARGDLPTF